MINVTARIKRPNELVPYFDLPTGGVYKLQNGTDVYVKLIQPVGSLRSGDLEIGKDGRPILLDSSPGKDLVVHYLGYLIIDVERCAE